MNEDKEDETLNVLSEHFNPLNALYSKKVVVPVPSALVLDNVAKANALFSRNKNLDEQIIPPVKVKEQVQPSTTKDVDQVLKGSEKKKPSKNLLTQISSTSGPLAFLKTCMEKRIRVKVWTRGPREIRGYCIGFVAAFDKHWNLALEDVQEVWKRRKKRKTVLLGKANNPPLGWKAMGPVVKPPKVIVTRAEKGTETCERHVNQMLMRGEHIALISVSGT